MVGFKRIALAAALSIAAAWPASAQTLRIGLAEDPDALDPTIARTFVSRIVFAGLCDKLFDITPDLKIVPQLATGYTWGEGNTSLTLTLRKDVVFHDDEPFNAEAVKYNIERHLTLPGSTRRSEINVISAVDVIDDYTVKLTLSKPFVPLLAQFTDRAGMMISPKAGKASATPTGSTFANKPVCSGPFKFVERVAQDRIVLERFDKHWDKSRIHMARIVYQPIVDTSVRLANLQSGGLDFIERVLPTDLATLRKDSRFKVQSIVELGYQGITINLANGDKAKQPFGQEALVRQAFSLAIDRDAISQVVYAGEFLPGNQWVPPNSPWYIKNKPVEKRDVEKAKALLKQVGVAKPTVTMLVPSTSDTQQVGQVIQAMTAEAGFDLKLQTTEFAAGLAASTKGDFESILLAWSGRTDPDGNLTNFLACNASLNDGKYCNPKVDAAIEAARATGDNAERLRQYALATNEVLADDPIIYLYHRKWFYGHTAKLDGFVPYPDGLVRLRDLKFN